MCSLASMLADMSTLVKDEVESVFSESLPVAYTWKRSECQILNQHVNHSVKQHTCNSTSCLKL